MADSHLNQQRIFPGWRVGSGQGSEEADSEEALVSSLGIYAVQKSVPFKKVKKPDRQKTHGRGTESASKISESRKQE